MESLAVRVHIGHCCVSVGLLAVLHLCCTRDELDLGFSMLPWHSMAAVWCQVLLGSRIALSASVPPIPPFPVAPITWPNTCSLVLCDVCAECTLLGLLTPTSHGPDSSWDSRRAFHRSPPKELDRHAASRRGLLDHPSQCSQPWPVNAISIVTFQHASDHHASALGTCPGHHRLPSLPAIHCTDHIFSSDAR